MIRVWASCNVLVNEHVVKLCDKVLGAQLAGGIPVVGVVVQANAKPREWWMRGGYAFNSPRAAESAGSEVIHVREVLEDE